ncbi:MAG: hypothetical protein J7555_04730 [Chloroflexi bacterium]|jgi:hypothetical protein|nr:hypothetical protein [Chloroflexota bacterium]
MIDKEKKRERFLRDPLPLRLGALAATLGRISSSARRANDPAVVEQFLQEAKYYIEWTAAEFDPETAAELVSMQRLITLWQKVGQTAPPNPAQRLLLAVQAREWSKRTLELSGLLE